MTVSPLILPTPTPPSGSSPSNSPNWGDSSNNTTTSSEPTPPNGTTNEVEPSRPTHRVSLACLQCRSRHLKCDAAKPICTRCRADGVNCTYAQSRRRGHRRTRLPLDVVMINRPLPSPAAPTVTNSQSSNKTIENGITGYFPSTFDDPSKVNEHLIGLYYTYFHHDHPCALPRWALVQHYTTDPELLKPVVLVMQYIGSLFDSTTSSQPFRKAAQDALPIHPQLGNCTNPYQLQAMLLFGIAIYWCDEVELGIKILHHVVYNALNLKMHLEPFAAQNAGGNQVVEECFRRTWWMIYVTDGHIAGSTHSFPTRVSNVDLTAALPCEEEEYESGQIPTPRTLDDFDIREFLPEGDPGFSSFAHLVGLTRTLDLILSRNVPSTSNIREVCSQVDISLSAWCSLLPPSKRQCLTSNGEIDMQLFKANILINTYIVDLHRQLSDLAYSPIESVSRCKPPGPSQEALNADPEIRRLHTAKALLGIRRLNELLPLPVNISTHTPFLICMIANTLIAHFSACRYIFRGRALQLERERVRSCMGALRVLGEYWPLGKRTYGEMGIIAREILSLAEKDIPRLQHSPEVTQPTLNATDAGEVAGISQDFPASSFLDFSTLSQDMFGSCDTFNSLVDICL